MHIGVCVYLGEIGGGGAVHPATSILGRHSPCPQEKSHGELQVGSGGPGTPRAAWRVGLSNFDDDNYGACLLPSERQQGMVAEALEPNRVVHMAAP